MHNELNETCLHLPQLGDYNVKLVVDSVVHFILQIRDGEISVVKCDTTIAN